MADRDKIEEYKRKKVQLLEEREYEKFNKTLVRAIKSNSYNKVEALVQVAKEKRVEEKLPAIKNLLKTAINFRQHDIKILEFLTREFPVQLARNLDPQETLLHITVARQDHQGAEHILKCWKAEGDVMLHQFIHVPFKSASSQAGSCQEVELPLSMAAWNGDKDMIDLLIEYGASIKKANSRGQNVFHSLVQMTDENAKISKNLYRLQSAETPAKVVTTFQHLMKKAMATEEDVSNFQHLADILNAKDKNGYTPLTLAAKVGNREIFETIVNCDVYRLVDEETSVSNVYLYDVTDIDSCLSEPGKSAMELIAAGSRSRGNKYCELAEVCPVLQIIRDKWNHYKKWYIGWGILHFVVMLTCTILLAVANTGPQVKFHRGTADFAISSLLSIYSLSIAIVEITALSHRKCMQVRNLQGNTLFHILPLIFCPLALLYFILQFVTKEWASVPQSLSLILGWSFMLFFTHGIKNFSSFTVMISLALKDIFKFSVVYLLVLVPYAASMTMLHNLPLETHNATVLLAAPPLQLNPFSNFWRSLLTMFSLTLGLADIDETFQDATIPGFAIALYIVYLLTSYILLFNMVIALLSETCTRVSNNTEEQWHLQKLRIILYIETHLLWKHKHASGIPQHSSVKQAPEPQTPKDVDPSILPKKFQPKKSSHDTSNRCYFKVTTLTQRTIGEFSKAKSVAKALGWMKNNRNTGNLLRPQDSAEMAQSVDKSMRNEREIENTQKSDPSNV